MTSPQVPTKHEALALRLAEAYDEIDYETAAELRRLHDLLGKANALCRIRYDRIKELQAENEALRADAERYRWLRERATVSHSQIAIPDRVIYPTTWHFVTGGSDVDMNAAIDAAMKENP